MDQGECAENLRTKLRFQSFRASEINQPSTCNTGRMYDSVQGAKSLQGLRQGKAHLLLIRHIRLDGEKFPTTFFEGFQLLMLLFCRL